MEMFYQNTLSQKAFLNFVMTFFKIALIYPPLSQKREILCINCQL